ncbi:hydroxymethylglutaryl-CoA reductase, degradative [Lacticaseibacillus saniviri]|uniref:3-hydroxy-3-methylglutaryl coenzyme A reductase n=1 Tax=Lacticaseibacillus saniviri JCM 17471 = DSM 24301 TaxID=1293598 RepID=A0A0R2MV14_9LACO|nr:hydroxymethylglutaryl-CoA reductase, degradative [Lacticaseibacillus saniviri]KRO16139.1 hydroxymethylglutaryl-CoA reductase, degradative [Lacticaseibacillus saniviri JCM 17471 = DSM 24301]MCG4282123.1 hydroxymethylglutaryl-CoA reductase, degradative [Lacticaseibacillus saniviri]
MPKFYELTPQERLAVLVDAGQLDQADADAYATQAALPEAVAEHLIENQIGQFSLPLGVLRDLPVNDALYQVPMVTEEPSVIAAANNGARIARLNGGITVTTMPHRVTGEVVFDGLADLAGAKAMILAREPELFAVAEQAHPSIVRRGGGLKTIEVVIIADRWLKLQLAVDPQAAMGANIVNTIAEAIGHHVGQWLNQMPLVAILANHSTALTTATVQLDPATLATAHQSGEMVAERIAAISALAEVDIDRTVTHNKGIMNGMTAAVLASGNDTRAVEAAVHAHASHTGRYLPLATWQLRDHQLVGTISLPLPVGIVGGAMNALPLVQVNQRLAHITSVETLQALIASVGLVQNLAALRALVGPGIQAGHMALQASALAMAAGATGAEIKLLTDALQSQDKTLANAKQLLNELRDQHKG